MAQVKGGVVTPLKRVKDDGKILPWLTRQLTYTLVAIYRHLLSSSILAASKLITRFYLLPFVGDNSSNRYY